MPLALLYKAVLLVVIVTSGAATTGVVYYYQRTADLNSQVARLNTSNNDNNSLKDQVANLTNQVNNLNRQFHQLQINNTLLQSELQQAQAQVVQLQAELATLQSQNSQLQAQVLQLEVNQLQAQLSNALGLCSSGKTLTIGELTDLSRDLSTEGIRNEHASLIAIRDINSFLTTTGCDLNFTLSVKDYQLDNGMALSELQSLASQGVQVVVGPLNSGAAQYLLAYANSNHIVLISPSSTSPLLAINNDYLFRTVPNDAAQASADARMMVDRGASAVIIVQKHDAYGDGVAAATAARFTQLGGTVIDTIQYDAAATDFTSTLTILQADYNNNVARYGAGHVALDFISF